MCDYNKHNCILFISDSHNGYPTPSKTDMCQEKDKEVYQAPV